MNQWYSKELGDGTQAFAPTSAIQEAFLPLFAASGRPIGMAVFSRYDLEKNLVTVYFSPRAEALAKMFGAQPCEKPSITNIALDVGDARCWQELFPGETTKGIK